MFFHVFMYLSTCACVLVFKYDFNIYLIRDEDKNNSAQYEVKIAVELKSCFLLDWAKKLYLVGNVIKCTVMLKSLCMRVEGSM